MVLEPKVVFPQWMRVESYEFWRYQPNHPLWKLVKFQSRSICPHVCSWCCVFNCSLCCLNCKQPLWKEHAKTSKVLSRTAWFVDTLLSPTQLRLGGLIHSKSHRQSCRHCISSVPHSTGMMLPSFKASEKVASIQVNQFVADSFWPSAFVIADVAVCSAARGVLQGSAFQ